MAREKPNYRDMLEFLCGQYPLMMTRADVQNSLNISAPTLRKMIRRGDLKVVDGKIPIGSVASLLCG